MQLDGSKGAAGAASACVIGDPIAHSRSPIIHNYWLANLGLPGEYTRRRVLSAELDDFLNDVRSGALRGGNVTVPHKEAIARKVDRLTDTARRLGAVNTVWAEDGLVWGDNTDGTGFLANLDDRSPGWDAVSDMAVVLGAGGAARAIVFALLQRGFLDVVITNRSESRAGQLATELEDEGKSRLRVVDWDKRSEILAGAAFVVNTTSLGMTGQPPLPIELECLPAHAVVHDIVYAPLETTLLKAARDRGLKAVDGLGMLLHQAVPGFARWFGQKPQVTQELRQLIVDDMNRSKT